MICVDASLAAKWTFDEEDCLQARALFRDSVTAAEPVIGPPLLHLELTNIIRQRMRRVKPPATSLLAPAEAREALDRFLAMPVEVSLPGILDREALELTITYGLPSAYDAYYVALAESLGCDLWTADRRLFDAVQGKLPFVRWVGDYGQR